MKNEVSLDEVMKKIHQINLQFLKDFDEIARKHQIPYTLAAGTLLGAVRHQGFIPWDNDVDVSMMRSDFEKLWPYLKKELDPALYQLVLPEDYGKKYRDMVPYINYQKARIEVDAGFDAFYEEKSSHMTLDFFLFDKVPDDFRGKLLVWRLEFLYGLLNAHRYSVDYANYHGLFKIAAFVLLHIGKLIPAEKLRNRVKKVASTYDNRADVHTISITNDLMSSFVYRFPVSWYEQGRTARFEDRDFPVPMEAEKALTLHFGDFMTLPPKEKQIPHLSILGTVGDDTITPEKYIFEKE